MDTVGGAPAEMLPLLDLIASRVIMGGVNQASGNIVVQINLAAKGGERCTEKLGPALLDVPPDTLVDSIEGA
jgi:hypothetical protein